jgi:hypothetical protein
VLAGAASCGAGSLQPGNAWLRGVGRNPSAVRFAFARRGGVRSEFPSVARAGELIAQKPTGPALGRPCWCCPVEQNYLLFFFAVFLAAFLAAAFFFLAMVWLPLCYA